MDELRRLEADSIRRFVASCAPLLAGRVLDYGCGLAPYRDIVDAAGGSWAGVDRPGYPGSVMAEEPLSRAGYLCGDSPFGHGERWDAILCTQVVQYIPDLPKLLAAFRAALERTGGALVLTGPTCWPEVEEADLCRYTRAGIRRQLEGAGLAVVRLEGRGHVEAAGNRFPVGWGAVARPVK